ACRFAPRRGDRRYRFSAGHAGAAGWWYKQRMTDANQQEADEQEQKRPLTLRGSGTLGLRRPAAETGQVRQSFSHGRSKAVTVEVRKKRLIAPGATPEPGRPATPQPDAPVVARAQPAAAPEAAEPARRPVALPRALTAEERAGRVRALQD